MGFLYLILGYIATVILEQVLIHDKLLNKEFGKHHVPIFGYHVHHSIYGLISIFFATILAFIDPSKILFFVSFGWGIIIRHTINDRRFVFINKMSSEKLTK